MKDWQPTASIPALRKRGEILANIRQFFAERNVLEVETPVMSHCAVSDPFIDSIETQYQPFPEAEVSPCYLQTSPEYAMKRLLAAGSGSIYQMAKAFRNGEQGHVHNPEFTMLEWYREGFDDLMLMSEVEALVAKILNIETPFIRLTYQQAFERYLAVDLTKCSDDEVKELALQHIDVNLENANRDDWLNLLMSHVIEPQLASLNQPVFITDYPASQAALARTKINANGKLVAAR
ncbi:MAG: EF-P lysine aminoacylase GenX, partial [Pontibacterium sp.]